MEDAEGRGIGTFIEVIYLHKILPVRRRPCINGIHCLYGEITTLSVKRSFSSCRSWRNYGQANR